MTEAEHEQDVPEQPEPLAPDEQEQADEEEQAEEEQPPPAPPAEPEPESKADKVRTAKLKQATTSYRRRVTELLGETAEALVTCELCGDGIPGFHFPPEWIEPETEVEARLLEVLRTPGEPDYRDAPNASRCTTCDGWGKVQSGSRVAGKGTVVCVACKGYGYTPPPTAGVEHGATPNGDTFTPAEPVEDIARADTDPWGSPRLLPDGQENPNYGRMPQYKIAGVP